MKCPKCGFDNYEGASVCCNCHAKLPKGGAAGKKDGKKNKIADGALSAPDALPQDLKINTPAKDRKKLYAGLGIAGIAAVCALSAYIYTESAKENAARQQMLKNIPVTAASDAPAADTGAETAASAGTQTASSAASAEESAAPAVQEVPPLTEETGSEKTGYIYVPQNAEAENGTVKIGSAVITAGTSGKEYASPEEAFAALTAEMKDYAFTAGGSVCSVGGAECFGGDGVGKDGTTYAKVFVITGDAEKDGVLTDVSASAVSGASGTAAQGSSSPSGKVYRTVTAVFGTDSSAEVSAVLSTWHAHAETDASGQSSAASASVSG